MSNYYYHFLKAFLFFNRSINWSREQVLQYQNRKVKEMVIHAGKNVPYYRNLFSEIGLDINSFHGIEDLHKIPLLDKESIRKNPDAFLSDGYQRYGGGWIKTSGSTGTPIKLWIDNISKAYKYAAVIRAYDQGGYHLFKKALIVQGYSESKAKPFGYRILTNSLYFNASANCEKTFLKFYPLFRRFSPPVIMGYARSVAQMALFMQENALKIPRVKSIVNYGQNVPEETIKFLEDSFQCKVFDVYSHAENAVLVHTFKGGAYRIAEDFFYPEFTKQIDSNFDELIGTSFYSYAMPLIRYKTRDLIEVGLLDDKSCFRNVKRIIGRIDDRILLPNGSSVYFAEGALGYAEGIIAAQYIQEEHNLLKILLVVDDQFKEEYFMQIEKGLTKRLGNELKYEFVITDQLEKNSSGKIPFIINRI